MANTEKILLFLSPNEFQEAVKERAMQLSSFNNETIEAMEFMDEDDPRIKRWNESMNQAHRDLLEEYTYQKIAMKTSELDEFTIKTLEFMDDNDVRVQAWRMALDEVKQTVNDNDLWNKYSEPEPDDNYKPVEQSSDTTEKHEKISSILGAGLGVGWLIASFIGDGVVCYLLYWNHWGYAMALSFLLTLLSGPSTISSIAWFVFIICKIAQFIFQ